MLSGALHAPYPGIEDSLQPGGMLREVAAATGRRIVFFCAFGERSAMAVEAAKEAGLANTAHIEGGIDAWKKAGGAGGARLMTGIQRFRQHHRRRTWSAFPGSRCAFQTDRSAPANWLRLDTLRSSLRRIRIALR